MKVKHLLALCVTAVVVGIALDWVWLFATAFSIGFVVFMGAFIHATIDRWIQQAGLSVLEEE